MKRIENILLLLTVFLSAQMLLASDPYEKLIKNSAEQLNYLHDRNDLSEANGTDDKWYIYFLGGTVEDLRHIEDGTGKIGESYLRGLNDELVHINESADTAVYVAFTLYEQEIITPIFPKDATTLGLQQKYVNESLGDGPDGAVEKFSIYTEKYKELAQKIYERTWLFKMNRTNVLLPFSMLTTREIQDGGGGAIKKTYNAYTLYAPQIAPDFDRVAFKKLFNENYAALGATPIERKMERLVYAIDEYFINGKRPEVKPCENLLASEEYKELVGQVGKNDIWIQVIDDNPCILEEMYNYDEGHFDPGAKEYEEMLAKVVCYPLYGALAIPVFSVIGPQAVIEMGKRLLQRFSKKKLADAGSAITVDFTMQFAINYYFHPEVNQKTGADRYSAAVELTQLDDIAASAISSLNDFDIPVELVSACLTGGNDVDIEVLMNPERYFSGSFDFGECQQNVLVFLLLNAATKNLDNHTATLGRFADLVKDSPESVHRGLKEMIGDSNMQGLLPALREQWQALVEVLGIPKGSNLYDMLSGKKNPINSTRVVRSLYNKNITVKGTTIRPTHIEKLDNGKYHVVIVKNNTLSNPADALKSLTEKQKIVVNEFTQGTVGSISKESADFLATSKSIEIQDISIRDAEGKSYSVIENINNAGGELANWVDDFYTIPRSKESLKKLVDEDLLKLVPEITADEAAAMHRYTVNNFELTIASYGSGFSPVQESWVNLLNSGFNKLRKVKGYQGKVFRGSNLAPEYLRPYIEAWESSSKVKIEPPFLSTSKSEKIADDFINKFKQDGKTEVMFEIKSKSGVYIDEISDYGKNLCIKNPKCTDVQLEVILKNKSSYRIDNLEPITKPDGTIRYIIKMTEL